MLCRVFEGVQGAWTQGESQFVGAGFLIDVAFITS